MSEFTYCLNASTIRPTPLLEKIRIAQEAGYQAMELWNNEVNDYLAAGGSMPELKTALGDAGLKVLSMIALHGWISAEGDAYATVLDECERRMAQAAELNCPYVIASPPREIVNLEHASKRYAELLRVGRRFGVRPSMEFLGFASGIKTAAGAWAVAAGTGDPDATVVADVFHLIRGGGSVDDLLSLSGNRIAMFHINDVPTEPPTAIQTDADRVMVGEGTADLPRVIANLRTIGYRGPLSLELFNPTLWEEDPAEVARRGLDRVRALVEG